MFEKFANEVGKAHIQLMEGAITYHEFFNYAAHRVEVIMQSDAYMTLVRDRKAYDESLTGVQAEQLEQLHCPVHDLWLPPGITNCPRCEE